MLVMESWRTIVQLLVPARQWLCWRIPPSAMFVDPKGSQGSENIRKMRQVPWMIMPHTFWEKGFSKFKYAVFFAMICKFYTFSQMFMDTKHHQTISALSASVHFLKLYEEHELICKERMVSKSCSTCLIPARIILTVRIHGQLRDIATSKHPQFAKTAHVMSKDIPSEFETTMENHHHLK